MELKQEFQQVIEKIVGPSRVATEENICLSYAYNAVLGKDVVRKPDMVAMAQTTAEVSEILQAANQYHVPVTPKGITGTTGHGGCLRGGVLLDLTLMDQILLIDPVNMKAVTEAACSFFKLAQELFKVDLMLPTAPYGPGPNVAASAITPVNAFGETKYGANINLVEGFEVVLPSGEIVQIGSLAYQDKPFGPYYRYITGPDLVGLFTKSNGALGIVTKVAYRCLKKPQCWSFHTYYWPEDQIKELAQMVLETTAAEIFDVHLNDRWSWAMIQSVRIPDDCFYLAEFILNGENEQELAGREQCLREICESLGGKNLPGFAEDFYTRWPTHFMFMEMVVPPRSTLPAKMPRRYMIMFDELLFPTSWLPEVYTKMVALCKKYDILNFPKIAAFSGFPMNAQTISGHWWTPIDDTDPQVMESFYACQAEFRAWFGEQGGTFQQRIPPAAPDYAWTNQLGAFNLIRRIKELLDPNDILSPGTFELGEV
ncbi:MAG: FAD-binding oxidoreductase [Peptococcaceae bacterium]|nr:FAD-binding oxidoreductase [Peptococcaceae bacterium]